jgi:hypothetical protein
MRSFLILGQLVATSGKFFFPFVEQEARYMLTASGKAL